LVCSALLLLVVPTAALPQWRVVVVSIYIIVDAIAKRRESKSLSLCLTLFWSLHWHSRRIPSPTHTHALDSVVDALADSFSLSLLPPSLCPFLPRTLRSIDDSCFLTAMLLLVVLIVVVVVMIKQFILPTLPHKQQQQLRQRLLCFCLLLLLYVTFYLDFICLLFIAAAAD